MVDSINSNQLQVSYPTSVFMKVIMDNNKGQEENRNILIEVVKRLNLEADGWSQKLSPEGKYISFSFTTMMPSSEILHTLHSELKKTPGVKFVI